MTNCIYLVTQNDTQRLIRATNQAAARSFAARSTISVSVATVDESIALAIKGVRVEDSAVPEVAESHQIPGGTIDSLDQEVAA